MTKEVSSTAGFCPWVLSFESLSVCNELAACIQAIWNRISACLSALSQWLHASADNKLVTSAWKLNGNTHDCVMFFLSPEDRALSERVCKSWKVSDADWHKYCRLERVSYELPEGRRKEAFSNPKPPEAFGLEAWREHLEVALDPKTVPRLPARIHRQLAQRKETHILYFRPQAVGNKGWVDAIAALRQKAGIEQCNMLRHVCAYITENEKSHPAPSRWLWMQKNPEPESVGKSFQDALRDYPGELGGVVDLFLGIIIHHARYKTFPFSIPFCVRTSDVADETREKRSNITFDYSHDRGFVVGFKNNNPSVARVQPVDAFK